MGDRFTFTIETRHFEDDRGERDNVHGLDKKAVWRSRTTVCKALITREGSGRQWMWNASTLLSDCRTPTTSRRKTVLCML